MTKDVTTRCSAYLPVGEFILLYSAPKPIVITFEATYYTCGLKPRPQAFTHYRVTRRIFPPNSLGDVTFDNAPRTPGNEAAGKRISVCLLNSTMVGRRAQLL